MHDAPDGVMPVPLGAARRSRSHAQWSSRALSGFVSHSYVPPSVAAAYRSSRDASRAEEWLAHSDAVQLRRVLEQPMDLSLERVEPS